MTPTRFFFARIGQAFGLSRRQRRMSDAAAEMHLLREAEQILGQAVWERVETVEALGVEYWNLRKLVKEAEDIRITLENQESTLVGAHEERTAMLNSKSSLQIELEEKRAALLAELDHSTRERDSVVQQAREIRRVYEGLKTKLEVLQREASSDEVEATRVRMDELKAKFNGLKADRDRVSSNVAQGEATLKKLDAELSEERQKVRDTASTSFQQIGQVNRDISGLKARLGLIDTQTRQLFSEVGRHISHHARNHEQCRKVAKEHLAMIDVMDALRTSIQLNHRLAGR